jgi:hypothetical protein
MARFLVLPFLLVFMVMVATIFASVEAYLFGKSLLSGTKKNPAG